jgi:DNA-binding transcriptional MerR regulator
MATFGIGALAKRAGVAIDTVRYYERTGLLAATGRLPSGYRRYGDPEFRRLLFIRRAKALGFSLEDIRSLLMLSGESIVAEVKRTAQAKLLDIDGRIAELQRIAAGLRSLIDACPGHGQAAACPILSALTYEEST